MECSRRERPPQRAREQASGASGSGGKQADRARAVQRGLLSAKRREADHVGEEERELLVVLRQAAASEPRAAALAVRDFQNAPPRQTRLLPGRGTP